jgi:hypothetical protein
VNRIIAPHRAAENHRQDFQALADQAAEKFHRGLAGIAVGGGDRGVAGVTGQLSLGLEPRSCMLKSYSHCAPAIGPHERLGRPGRRHRMTHRRPSIACVSGVGATDIATCDAVSGV